MVIAIDGPAGAGKSTAARRLAERLGFEFLDTGAMYRCVTLEALTRNADLSDAHTIAQIAAECDIQFEGTSVYLNGRDVSKEIRDPRVSTSIGAIADNPEVRGILTGLQRRWAQGRSAVSEGRDQGTEVFPDSPCKIFLTASNEERARRRCEELAAKGIESDLETVLQQQTVRDDEDRRRPIGGLREADDSIRVLTDGMTLDEVVDHLFEIVRSRIGDRSK